MDRFWLALSFLTAVPARQSKRFQEGDLGRAAFFFPWIGLLLGGVLFGAHYSLTRIFSPYLAGALTAALWAGLTGGLHLDGLADCCDGLLAPVSVERRLEILRDPRLGTFGGVGLVLALLIKCLVLASLPGLSLGLILAPAAARWLLLPIALQPAARPGGLGAEFSRGLRRSTLLLAAVLPLGLTLLTGVRGIVGVGLAGLASVGIARLARARLGGITGDVLGLTVEICELVILLVFAANPGLFLG